MLTSNFVKCFCCWIIYIYIVYWLNRQRHEGIGPVGDVFVYLGNKYQYIWHIHKSMVLAYIVYNSIELLEI